MKIVRFETFLANAGLRNYLFIRLTTDTGLSGVGEATLEWQEKTVGWPIVIVSAMFSIILTSGAALYGYHRLASIDKMIAGSQSVTVSVIQGNIDQDVKWDKE